MIEKINIAELYARRKANTVRHKIAVSFIRL